jgi:hypothetical protein
MPAPVAQVVVEHGDELIAQFGVRYASISRALVRQASITGRACRSTAAEEAWC